MPPASSSLSHNVARLSGGSSLLLSRRHRASKATNFPLNHQPARLSGEPAEKSHPRKPTKPSPLHHQSARLLGVLRGNQAADLVGDFHLFSTCTRRLTFSPPDSQEALFFRSVSSPPWQPRVPLVISPVTSTSHKQQSEATVTSTSHKPREPLQPRVPLQTCVPLTRSVERVNRGLFESWWKPRHRPGVPSTLLYLQAVPSHPARIHCVQSISLLELLNYKKCKYQDQYKDRDQYKYKYKHGFFPHMVLFTHGWQPCFASPFFSLCFFFFFSCGSGGQRLRSLCDRQPVSGPRNRSYKQYAPAPYCIASQLW